MSWLLLRLVISMHGLNMKYCSGIKNTVFRNVKSFSLAKNCSSVLKTGTELSPEIESYLTHYIASADFKRQSSYPLPLEP